MESLHGGTDSRAKGKPSPLPGSPLSLCPRCQHRGISQAGMWLHSSPVPQTPIWSPAGCAPAAGGHCNDLSPFVINPGLYPWHSIPRATAASSSASAPSHPSPPVSPHVPGEPERAGGSCQAPAFSWKGAVAPGSKGAAAFLSRSPSRSWVPRAHFSLAGANGRS